MKVSTTIRAGTDFFAMEHEDDQLFRNNEREFQSITEGIAGNSKIVIGKKKIIRNPNLDHIHKVK